MTRLALLAALISSQAFAAVEQVKPETRIQPEKPIDAHLEQGSCNQVLIGPDGELVEIGRFAFRREC
jgi:hypothetical protein